MEEFSAILRVEYEDGTVFNAEVWLRKWPKIKYWCLSVLVENGYFFKTRMSNEKAATLPERLLQGELKLYHIVDGLMEEESIFGDVIRFVNDRTDNIEFYAIESENTRCPEPFDNICNEHVQKAFKMYIDSQILQFK